MGITYTKISIKNARSAKKTVDVKFMVDSGAIFSLVPAETLKAIGCKPYKKIEFCLADGSIIIERKVGDVFFTFNDNMAPAPVIFGEKGDEPLLGATTLEALGLLLNPLTRTLHPMKMFLGALTQKK